MHDDGFAAGFGVTSTSARADVDFTATGAVGLFNAATAVDNGGGRKSGQEYAPSALQC